MGETRPVITTVSTDIVPPLHRINPLIVPYTTAHLIIIVIAPRVCVCLCVYLWELYEPLLSKHMHLFDRLLK